MHVEKKSQEEMKVNEESLDAFAVVYAESESGLYTEHLVPIYEEYDKRNFSGEKAFRLVPREFAVKLLKFEPNSMIPETNFTEEEKQALNAFAKKNYFKSAIVAGKRVYFDLNSKIRRYLGTVLGHVQ